METKELQGLRAEGRRQGHKGQNEQERREHFSDWRVEGMCGAVVGTHSVGEQEPGMEGLVIKKNIYFILRAKEHI